MYYYYCKPTDPFTVLEPRDLEIGEFNLAEKRRIFKNKNCARVGREMKPQDMYVWAIGTHAKFVSNISPRKILKGGLAV